MTAGIVSGGVLGTVVVAAAGAVCLVLGVALLAVGWLFVVADDHAGWGFGRLGWVGVGIALLGCAFVGVGIGTIGVVAGGGLA